VDDPDATHQRHCYRHLCLGHSVHRRAHQRGVERDSPADGAIGQWPSLTRSPLPLFPDACNNLCERRFSRHVSGFKVDVPWEQQEITAYDKKGWGEYVRVPQLHSAKTNDIFNEIYWAMVSVNVLVCETEATRHELVRSEPIFRHISAQT
jgi:hypothetical protein